MEKSLFEQMGGTYRQVGDYLLPDLTLSEEKEVEIGVWGQRHGRYLKEHRRATYYKVHSPEQKYAKTGKVKVDIYFTAVGMLDIPTDKEILSMIEEMQKNPVTCKTVA